MGGERRTHPWAPSGGAVRRPSGWGLCSRGREWACWPQAAALASGWAHGGTSDAQSHSPAMLEMLALSLFELQGILKKKKKRAINSCFGNGRDGISLNPSQTVRGAGSVGPGQRAACEPLGHGACWCSPRPARAPDLQSTLRAEPEGTGCVREADPGLSGSSRGPREGWQAAKGRAGQRQARSSHQEPEAPGRGARGPTTRPARHHGA